MRFYKDTTTGLFFVNDSILPSGNYRLNFYKNDTVITLEDVTIDEEPVIDTVKITNIEKESGGFYTDRDDLLAGIKDLFLSGGDAAAIIDAITYPIEVALGALETDIEVKRVASFPIPENITVTDVKIQLYVAPVGSSAIFDIKINGTSILSTLIVVSSGDTDSASPVFSTTDLNALDKCTVECTQIGATTAGQEPVLFITHTKR